MECIYRRRALSEGPEKRGILRKNGLSFTLLSSEGSPIDRLFPKKTFFSGALYVAYTGGTGEAGRDSSRDEGAEMREFKPLGMKGQPAKKTLPPPEGSLIFGPNAYIEPFLAGRLKDYQEEGIVFLYNRLKRSPGAILADEMGLGKTLQAISLVYLFCKIGLKVLVLVPCSLAGVWEREIKKWLETRLSTFNGPDKGVKKYRGERVLILNYEKFAANEEFLMKEQFSLIVCDEAHRLRSDNSQALMSLKKFAAKKLLITGTPFQNNLQEYKTLLSLVENNLSTPLSDISRNAILHRSISRTTLKLPEKKEIVYVLKNEAEEEYKALYRSMERPGINDIQRLRAALHSCPSKWKLFRKIIRETSESVVAVTRYVEVLNRMVEELKGGPFEVITFYGEMGRAEREEALRKFEEPGRKIFLLTAKTGGEGLTLVKAKELIVFDTDWNPANDLQIIGRIWRIGQTVPVKIHRVLVMGSIEESIFLTQLRKLELQKTLTGEESSVDLEGLTLRPSGESIIHEYSACRCPHGRKEAIFGYDHEATEEGMIMMKVE
jgi:SNF2 family DNA or RNA helicase